MNAFALINKLPGMSAVTKSTTRCWVALVITIIIAGGALAAGIQILNPQWFAACTTRVPILGTHMADQARRANRERWYRESNTPPPTLLEVRTAAEGGSAPAQNSLAEIYASQQDFDNAVKWYRKAAEQGHTHAQLVLALILLEGRKETATSRDVPRDADEAVLWLGRAANQGDLQARVELAGCYQRGAGVDPNLVQAYKWFALADPQSNAVARVALEHLHLQMSREDIVAGREAAALFVPTATGNLPEPSYLNQLRLQGITTSTTKPLAIVNNRTLAESEETSVKLGGKTMTLRCLNIETASVLVQVGPFRKQLQLGN